MRVVELTFNACRPRLQIWWPVSVLAAAACFIFMFLVSWYYALATFALMVLIYKYVADDSLAHTQLYPPSSVVDIISLT